MVRMHASTAILLLCAPLVGCGDDDSGDDPAPMTQAPVILDPAETHYGMTYSDWNAEWFRWVFEIEVDDQCQAPLDDMSGALCGLGQSGDVFFLAGGFGGGNVVRDDCVVPAGKALLFPLTNTVADNAGVPEEEQFTAEELSDWVTADVDMVMPENLFASVDGQDVPELERFKTDVVEFSYELPAEPNFYSCFAGGGVTGVVDPAYAAGYYLMLAPLSPGSHELTFGIDQGADLSSSATYNLTVE